MNNQSQPKGYMGAPYVGNIYGQQQQQGNLQSKDLFQTLAKEFQYQIVKAPNEYTQSAIVMLRNFQIRIDQNYNIGIPPTCSLNNAPYDYTKFYQWNNNSSHLSLVRAIQDQLELHSKILSNPIIKNYSEFINLFHIDESVNRIKNMPLPQILPLIQPSEYQQWISSDEKLQTLKAQLSQTQELKNLKEQMLQYAQQNEIVADLIEANDKEIKTKIERLQNRNRLLEDEKDNYIQLQNRSRALSERFQDSKVNTLFQQICEKYDEISDKLLESETNGDYEDQANQYFQSRRKYQKTLALSEKFRQMKQI
ncbi:unnamed protein product (macronuclear) [Paramecium tetraurelia]|uniref:VPS37 C-terminal domain-containing protein n=1 Tax=Paramecium tetraurelia TaxID=5888 RepID=A0DGP6_PARTE|nr:uncharacterized protein GSPATT00002342001 [Paramecium tetraurelia]CAK82213.1 unnamed protein product [Paramecium tetraurelia]|eukprot:XP_001449610.1 hypothetical protein (macronuclear) [Paramecium tetraurelia strain d4-2]